MDEEQLTAMVAAFRDKAAAEMRELLGNAPPHVLQKVAVDIVPALVRIASYTGEPFGRGEHYGEAVARSSVTGLGPILVHVHRARFGPREGEQVAASMKSAGASQVAVAFVDPHATNVAPFIGAEVHWTLDLDGLVNLMLGAGLGVTQRTFEAKFVDAPYFL